MHSLSKQTEKQASNKVKLIAVAVGILVTGLVFVVEQLGSIFQLSTQLTGLVSGSLLAMFALGMMSRSANSKVWIFTEIDMRIYFVFEFSFPSVVVPFDFRVWSLAWARHAYCWPLCLSVPSWIIYRKIQRYQCKPMNVQLMVIRSSNITCTLTESMGDFIIS